MEAGRKQITKDTTVCISIAEKPSNFGATIFNAAFQALGLDFIYKPFAVNAEQLEGAVKGIKSFGIRGCGVSMPHKSEVIKYLDGIDSTAKEKGAEYIIKTRTDQRIYGVNSYQFLLSLLELFPVKNGYGQKYRIITTNVFSLKYIPCVISDMTVFGYIDDMMIYWGVNLVEGQPPNDIVFSDPYLGSEKVKLNLGGGEAYLFTQFLKAIRRDFKWTLEDYWNILADHFCIIDYQSLDIYWHKPERHHFEENKFLRYDAGKSYQPLSFRDWLNLYSGSHL